MTFKKIKMIGFVSYTLQRSNLTYCTYVGGGRGVVFAG